MTRKNSALKLTAMALSAAIMFTACQKSHDTQQSNGKPDSSPNISSQQAPSSSSQPNENNQLLIEEEIMPEISVYEYGGGDELNEFYVVADRRFLYFSYIMKSLENDFGKEKYNECDQWCVRMKDIFELEKEPMDITTEPSLPLLVKKYSLSPEWVKKILNETNKLSQKYNDKEIIYTNAEIEAIAAGDVEKCIETMMAEGAVRKGNLLYSPAYIYSHTMQELEAVGITAEELQSHTDFYETIPLKKDAQKAFQNKILKYAVLQAQKGKYSGTFMISEYADFEVPEKIGGATFIKPKHENPQLLIEEEIMPEISVSEYGGGDELNEFYITVTPKFQNTSYFMELYKKDFGEEKFNECNNWIATAKNIFEIEKNHFNISTEPSLPLLVKEFKISPEWVRRALNAENEISIKLNQTEHMYSEAEIEAIAAGDVEKCIETMTAKGAVRKSNLLYSPAYIYSHTMQELEAVGITAEELQSHADFYETIPLREDAQKAFQNKILKYAALQAQKGKYSGTFMISKYADFEVPEKIGGATFIKPKHENPQLLIEEEIMPEISVSEYDGGDEKIALYVTGGIKLGTYSDSFIKYLKESLSAEEYDEFSQLLNDSDNPADNAGKPENIFEIPSLPYAVKTYKLEYEKVAQILRDETALCKKLGTTETIYTDEEIDAIASGNIEKSYELMGADTAILIDGKVYCPAYIYTHTMEELEKENVPVEALTSNLKLYEQLPLVKDAQKAFQNKILKYAALQAQKGKYSGTFMISKYADFEVPEKIGNAIFKKQ